MSGPLLAALLAACCSLQAAAVRLQREPHLDVAQAVQLGRQAEQALSEGPLRKMGPLVLSTHTVAGRLPTNKGSKAWGSDKLKAMGVTGTINGDFSAGVFGTAGTDSAKTAHAFYGGGYRGLEGKGKSKYGLPSAYGVVGVAEVEPGSLEALHAVPSKEGGANFVHTKIRTSTGHLAAQQLPAWVQRVLSKAPEQTARAPQARSQADAAEEAAKQRAAEADATAEAAKQRAAEVRKYMEAKQAEEAARAAKATEELQERAAAKERKAQEEARAREAAERAAAEAARAQAAEVSKPAERTQDAKATQRAEAKGAAAAPRMEGQVPGSDWLAKVGEAIKAASAAQAAPAAAAAAAASEDSRGGSKKGDFFRKVADALSHPPTPEQLEKRKEFLKKLGEKVQPTPEQLEQGKDFLKQLGEKMQPALEKFKEGAAKDFTKKLGEDVFKKLGAKASAAATAPQAAGPDWLKNLQKAFAGSKP